MRKIVQSKQCGNYLKLIMRTFVTAQLLAIAAIGAQALKLETTDEPAYIEGYEYEGTAQF